MAWTDHTNVQRFWKIAHQLADAFPPRKVILKLTNGKIIQGQTSGFSTTGNPSQQIPNSWQGTVKLITHDNKSIEIDYLDIEAVEQIGTTN